MSVIINPTDSAESGGFRMLVDKVKAGRGSILVLFRRGQVVRVWACRVTA